ncbi:hypothetical protein Tsubulata_039089, partial [Turnera subulata]
MAKVMAMMKAVTVMKMKLPGMRMVRMKAQRMAMLRMKLLEICLLESKMQGMTLLIMKLPRMKYLEICLLRVNMVEDVGVNGEVRNEGQGINDRHEVQEGEGINVPQETTYTMTQMSKAATKMWKKKTMLRNQTEVPNDANLEHMQPQNTTQASTVDNGQSPQTQTSTVDQVGAAERNVAGSRGRGGGGGRGRSRGSGRGSGRGAGVTSNLEQPPHVGSEETQLIPQIGQQSRRKPPTANPTRRTRSQSEISSSSVAFGRCTKRPKADTGSSSSG